MPKIENLLSVLNKASEFFGTKLRSVDDCLDTVVKGLWSGKFASKCIDLASRISQLAPDQSDSWVTKVIDTLVAASSSAETWFSETRSVTFLVAVNISIDTPSEVKLRIIADYSLSKLKPSTEEHLADHLRIAALFIQKANGGRSFFPSGSVLLLRQVLIDRQSFGFFVPQKLIAAAVKLFLEVSAFPSVNQILPELCAALPRQPLFRAINAEAENAAVKRIDEYLNRRVFPPMIRMIPPQLEYVPKFKSEEDMLRNQLKRARREAKRAEREAAAVKMQEMREAQRKKKEERDKTWKENIAMLEAGRTDDLNMAAAPAPEEEEDGSSSGEEEEEI